MPIISVLMPVYNAAAYLQEAIDSILSQTYTDFEFIIINDGSFDVSDEIIKKYNDARIRYYQNDGNRGIVYTLNRGIELAKGKYIARMDADDISHPDRFEKQLKYMETYHHLVACGTLYSIYGDDSNTPIDVATEADDIRFDMAIYCQFAHSTMMIRRDALLDYHLYYREEYRCAEDYKLWTELLQYGDIINVPEVLGTIRQCAEGISIQNATKQKELSNKVRRDYLNQMGVYPVVLLTDLDINKIDRATIKASLQAYFPLVRKAKSYNWLRKNFKSVLKQYLRSIPFGGRIREMKNWRTILCLKEQLAVMYK